MGYDENWDGREGVGYDENCGMEGKVWGMMETVGWKGRCGV